jgi:DNA-binding CsgD family transcriptional regulator
VVGAIDELERGRDAYARRAWPEAHSALLAADRAAPLGAEDLARLAVAAYMLGRDGEHAGILERAHRLRLDAGEALEAARCAFWIGINLALRGETAGASGWFGRAQRLVEREGRDCVERGYLLVPVMVRRLAEGEEGAALATATEAADAAARFGDRDLLALAVYHQGHALVRLGRVEEGLALLDEAMVAVAADELSPIVTGLVYCSVIDGCQEVYALERAREWTSALARWCEVQPGLVAFTGRCLVHRAELIQLDGAWEEALGEARRAYRRCREAANAAAAAEALYREGELQRLRGELAAAEEAYRGASRAGLEPQPGLALLRLAQGSVPAAAAMIRRVAAETTAPLRRARVLPALVEIELAAGDVAAARRASRELEELAPPGAGELLGATVALARGAVELAEGDARKALVSLRRAGQAWRELGAPYEAARTRTLIGLACRALGDDETATLELDSARAAFERLGAAPDLERLDALAPAPKRVAGGLTARELQVLRLVAAGATNRAIARELVLSERTVDRHVSNILAKLGVSSRAAATAAAYEHGLLGAAVLGGITHPAAE